MKIGIAALLCLAFALGSTITYLVVGSPYPADITTVWINNPPLHETNYVIGVYNSTHYYAKNGTTGNYDYIDTNASYVIQQALDKTFQSGGGVVWLTKATYHLTAGLKLPNTLGYGEESFVHLYSDGAILSVDSAVTTDVLVLDAQTKANYFLILQGFNIYPASKSPNYYGIKINNAMNIIIDKVILGWEGLKITNCDHVFLSNMYIVDTSNEGIYLYGVQYLQANSLSLDNVGGYGGYSGYNGIHIEFCGKQRWSDIWILGGKESTAGQEHGLYIRRSASISFNNLLIEGFQKNAVKIEQSQKITLCNFIIDSPELIGVEIVSGSDEPAQDIKLSNFVIRNAPDSSSRGIALWAQDGNPVRRISITSGTIENITATNSAGIALGDDNSAGAVCREVLVSNVNFENVYRPINEGYNSDYNSFIDNSFKNFTVPPYIIGNHTKLMFNQGYITENSGTATVANGETVSHGLDSTPVYVSITCMNATYDGEPVIVSVTAVSSSAFTVGVYWANGTAITNDVIGIYWEARTWS